MTKSITIYAVQSLQCKYRLFFGAWESSDNLLGQIKILQVVKIAQALANLTNSQV